MRSFSVKIVWAFHDATKQFETSLPFLRVEAHFNSFFKRFRPYLKKGIFEPKITIGELVRGKRSFRYPNNPSIQHQCETLLFSLKICKKNTRLKSIQFEVKSEAFLFSERIPDHHDNLNIGFIDRNFHFYEVKQRQMDRPLRMLALSKSISLKFAFFKRLFQLDIIILLKKKVNSKKMGFPDNRSFLRDHQQVLWTQIYFWAKCYQEKIKFQYIKFDGSSRPCFSSIGVQVQ